MYFFSNMNDNGKIEIVPVYSGTILAYVKEDPMDLLLVYQYIRKCLFGRMEKQNA